MVAPCTVSPESGDIDQVLSLFDDHIYPQHSDFYLDIQNAASLLTRLNFLGINTKPSGLKWLMP